MGQCVEVCRAGAVAHPQPFLSRRLKAGIVTLTLCTQGIDTLKTQAFPVNGKSVVCWNGLILGAASVLLAVVPVFVVTGANTGFGLAEGAAIFLPDTPSAIGGLAIILPEWGSAFYTNFLYQWSDFRFQPWPESIAITTLLEFCSWLIP